jgi:hypothetical protein
MLRGRRWRSRRSIRYNRLVGLANLRSKTMSQLVIPDEVRAILARATGPVDLLDRGGHKVGRYIPEPVAAEPFCPWDPTLTPEEADRIANEDESYTLDEIIRELEGR